MSRLESTTSYQLPDKNEFKYFYTLQKNNIRLQKNVDSGLKELLGFLKSTSTNISQWKAKWTQFDAENQSKLSEYESIWTLFRHSISSIDGFTDQIDTIVENLKHTRQSIPKLKSKQTLECKIKEARAKIDALHKDIEKLNEQKKNCENQIDHCQDSAWRNVLSCTTADKRSESLVQRQTSTNALIQDKTKTIQRNLRTFHDKKKSLYAESKEEEINRCQQLQVVSKRFLESFKLTSNEFNQSLAAYDAADEFTQWEENHSQKDTDQTRKPRSPKKKTPCDGNEQDD